MHFKIGWNAENNNNSHAPWNLLSAYANNDCTRPLQLNSLRAAWICDEKIVQWNLEQTLAHLQLSLMCVWSYSAIEHCAKCKMVFRCASLKCQSLLDYKSSCCCFVALWRESASVLDRHTKKCAIHFQTTWQDLVFQSQTLLWSRAWAHLQLKLKLCSFCFLSNPIFGDEMIVFFKWERISKLRPADE